MKTKKQKGDYGYLNKNKLIQLGLTLFLLMMVGLIFYTGYIKYGNTKNVFTVFACIMAIPAAKFGVSYIVMAPYKAGDVEIFEKINKLENAKIVCDLIVTSSEKVINIPFAVIRDNSIFCYINNAKYDKKYIEKYLYTFLQTDCKVTAVKIFDDSNQFIKAAENLDKNEAGRFDKRIRELMIIYSM